jgi:WD40 repeat protein
MKHRYLAVAAMVAVALAAPAATAKTQVFLETSEAEFAQGHADGIVWTNLGTMRLGRAVESLLPTTEGVDYVARLAEGPDGSIYAVTGGAGRIYRIKDGKVSLVATLADKFLFSCVVDKGGDLYVGSGGAKGRIWRVQPQAKGEAKAEIFFEADDVKYVWDLAWMKDGSLAAATGDKGKVFRISADKKSEVVLKSEADHILCLAIAPNGTLYAGTDGPSIVYRWDGKKAFVLFDADEAEVTALALDAAGNLFVAASSGTGGRAGGAEMPSEPSIIRSAIPASMPRNEMKEGAEPAPKKEGVLPPVEKSDAKEPAAKAPAPAAPPLTPAASLADRLQDAMATARSGGGKRPPGGAPSSGAAVYRVAPDGIVTRIFDGHETMILSLAVAEGQLLIGTGKSARVYETGCGADDEEACMASVDPKQVMSLMAMRDGRVVVGAAGPGRVYALSKGHAREGTYTSQAYDAGGSARWGAMDWRGRTPDGTEIRIATRTGNVRDPEKGMWSEWSKDVAKMPAKIESPSARFIQFRVTMRGRGDTTTPVLEQFEGAYQRVNEAPRVVSVGERASQDQAARSQALDRFRQTMKPPVRTGGPGGSPPPSSAPPPPAPEGPQPIRVIQWQAVDPNGDSLRYDVYMRGQGEPNWILLDKDLVQPQYAWDTSTVADGWYEIKVVAGDRADNPAETALEGFKVSDPILVDNTAPLIEKLQVQVKAGGDAEVTFAVRDATSRLTAAAYTIDSADQWRPLAPTDGLFDGRQKEFRFTLKKLIPGPHRLAVRAADEAQNIGHAAQVIQVGK